MRPFFGPQDISRVAVPVQPQPPDISRTRVTPLHPLKRVLHHAAIRVSQIERDEIMLENVARGLVAEAFDIELRPVSERLHPADRVDAPDEAPKPLERVAHLQVRAAAGPPRIERETVSGVFVQRAPAGQERRDHRNFVCRELQGEFVLLEDRVIRPAFRPIELRHERRTFLEIHEIDAVLEAVERKEPPVAAVSAVLHRVEHAVRREVLVRQRHASNR